MGRQGARTRAASDDGRHSTNGQAPRSTSRRRWGAVRPLPSGRWQARFPDWQGVLQAAPRTFATKAEAERWLVLAEAREASGLSGPAVRRPCDLRSYALEWVEHCAYLKPKTVAGYKGLLDGLILPTLGGMQVAAIRPGDVRSWASTLTRRPGRGDRPLSPSRRRQAQLLLGQILASAKADGLTDMVATESLSLPRMPTPDPTILTPAQVNSLIAAAEPPWKTMFRLLALCGLRFGEAVALTWDKLDVTTGTLRVDEAVVEVNGKRILGTTKNHQRRDLALPQSLVKELKLLRRSRSSSDLMFPNSVGNHLSYNAFRRSVWDPAVEKAGLSGVTPKTLRATCASWVADQAGVLEAARRLGHSQTTVTTRHYARPLPGRDRAVADGLARMLSS